MNISNINKLRKEGHLEDAYYECKTLLSEDNDNKYLRITMAWCLKSIAEKTAKEKDSDKFINILKELSELRLGEIGESSMTNLFSWDIKTLFESIKDEYDILISSADQILEILPSLSFTKPHKYYSLLADTFLKIKGRLNAVWPKFIEFMDWFGFENLMTEDYKRIPLKEKGRSFPSLAERIHIGYYKAIMYRINSAQIDKNIITDFLNRLTYLNKSHPEYQYTLYHKSLLLLALNRKEEALCAIRPFVRLKQNDFWVWDILSDTTDNPEIKLSCCCRALLCNTEPKFLVKVRLKAAQIMNSLGYKENASTELQELKKIYIENGWNIPREVIEMAQQPWYKACISNGSNTKFYQENLQASEAFLYIDIPEIPILITHYNHEKHICNFITKEQNQGFFSTRQTRVKFSENQLYLVRFQNELESGHISKVLTYKRIEDPKPYMGIFFKNIEGILKYHEGNSFGFINDVYIEKRFINDKISNNTYVSGTAVISYNKKKNSWGWKAIYLKPKEN